jgi:hypothetical protein
VVAVGAADATEIIARTDTTAGAAGAVDVEGAGVVAEAEDGAEDADTAPIATRKIAPISSHMKTATRCRSSPAQVCSRCTLTVMVFCGTPPQTSPANGPTRSCRAP